MIPHDFLHGLANSCAHFLSFALSSTLVPIFLLQVRQWFENWVLLLGCESCGNIVMRLESGWLLEHRRHYVVVGTFDCRIY